MSSEHVQVRQVGSGGRVRPLILVGFVGVAMIGFRPFQPDDSIVFIEEPDVIRKRDLREKVAGKEIVRELIGWEYQLPGKADEFFHAHRDLDPAGVIGLQEYTVPFAARLAERYGLPGAGYGAALILRDKELTRLVTRAAGIANPVSVRVHGPEQVRAVMAAAPGPIVLKPANRSASVGTQVIRESGQIEAAWVACTDQDEGVFVPDRPTELRMLAEHFVDGPEFSVETLLRAGQALFVNVTGKLLFPGPRPVEAGHVVPADIPDELSALLAQQTQRVLEAVGFQDGIAHCEWIVSDGVPYLLECAARFPGDGIIELIEAAYPVELKRMYAAVMKGEPVPEGALPHTAKGATAVRFLAARPGLVTAVRGAEAAAAAEGVVSCDVEIEPGERYVGLRSSFDRIGDLIVHADTPADAHRLIDAAAALIEIDVTPDTNTDTTPTND